jgi:hypothetical protein
MTQEPCAPGRPGWETPRPSLSPHLEAPSPSSVRGRRLALGAQSRRYTWRGWRSAGRDRNGGTGRLTGGGGLWWLASGQTGSGRSTGPAPPRESPPPHPDKCHDSQLRSLGPEVARFEVGRVQDARGK